MSIHTLGSNIDAHHMVLLGHTSVREARVGGSPGTKQTKCGFAAVLFK